MYFRRFTSFLFRKVRYAAIKLLQLKVLFRVWTLNLNASIHVSKDVYLDSDAKVEFSPDGINHGGSVQIGSKSKLSRGSTLCPFGGVIQLGDGVFVGPYTVLQSSKGGMLKIGSNVLIGGQSFIVASNHGMKGIEPVWKQSVSSKGITIEKDVWIAANVTILDGVTIGEGAVIGAGSIVTKNIEPFGIAMGAPAKVYKSRKLIE